MRRQRFLRPFHWAFRVDCDVGTVSLLVDGQVTMTADITGISWAPSPGEVSWPMTIVPWPIEGTP
jgi:hypothetical protein